MASERGDSAGAAALKAGGHGLDLERNLTVLLNQSCPTKITK